MPTAAHAGSLSPGTPAASGNGHLFTGSAAAWLYSAPTGSGLNISGMTAAMPINLNTHTAGFDYPVQYADGSNGCTTFTDKKYYDLQDQICVPNPAGGFHTSTGGYGADDGHLVVVDRSAGKYYDFWKLSVDGNGRPTSTDVGQIVEGSLDGDGTPGTTAAQISGLAGAIMPGELDCGTCLQHALSLIVPGTMNSSALGHQAPARHTDGAEAGAIFREGAKLRLDCREGDHACPAAIRRRHHRPERRKRHRNLYRARFAARPHRHRRDRQAPADLLLNPLEHQRDALADAD